MAGAVLVPDQGREEVEQAAGRHLRALLGAYAASRPFTRQEAEHWPSLLRIACLRFWLSRLMAVKSAPVTAEDGHQVLLKDPEEFRQRLAARQQTAPALPFAF